MKTKLSLSIVLMGSLAAYSQQVENDDLYFSAKDREKLNALSANKRTDSKRTDLDERLNEESRKNLTINPTDSYSSRNVNPDYVSRMKTNPSSQEEDPDYFVSGYQPAGVNPSLRNSYYSSNSFYSPYYSSSAFYDPYFGYSPGFGSPYFGRDPFWGWYPSRYYYPGSFFSMSFSWGWGGWYDPWYSWGSPYYWGSPSSYFWDNYYGWNSWGYGGGWCNRSYYGYGGYYPGSVVVINNGSGDSNRPRVVYGKRQDRSSGLNNPVDETRTSQSFTRTGREISSGRTRTQDSESSSSYYDRAWRRNSAVTQNRSYWNNSNSSSGTNDNSSYGRQRSSSWSNGNNNNSTYSAPTRNRSSWSNSNNSSSSFSAPSRSSSSWGNSGSSGSSSGGSRSHSSGGSSGGSHSRGRDN